MIKRIKTWLGIYSCFEEHNKQCKKRHCNYCGTGECKMTTQWRYAKRTPLNYIKRIINKTKGRF